MTNLPRASIVVLFVASVACAPMPTEEADPPRVEEASTAPQQPEESTPDVPEAAETDTGAAPPESAPPPPESPQPQTGPEAGEAESEPAADPVEAAVPTPEARVDLSGRLQLTGGDADPAEAVVFFVADESPASPADKPADAFEIVTENKTLRPTVLAVPAGATVRFPNRDPILHNLFSVSQGNDFDLGVYGPGDAPAVTLDTPGVVNIYCNVHHDMHAHVLVVDSPWHGRPDAQGNFRLTGLPPGPGELHVWHRQADRWSRRLELPQTETAAVELQVTKPRLPPHRDKTGQPYNRRDRDPYR